MKEMENKVVSLQQVYDQVQEMMDKAGIGTRTLWVEAKIVGYEHVKLGKHRAPSNVPDREMRVYIAGVNSGVGNISCTNASPTVVLETIKVELEKLKIVSNPVDTISDIQIEL